MRRLAALAAAVGLTTAGCGVSSDHPIGGGVRASGPGASHLLAVSTPTASVGSGRGLVMLSATYGIGPSGPLRSPTQVTLPLGVPAPADDTVVVATREAAEPAWSLLPATVAPDRRSVTFTTTHLSLFRAIGIDPRALVGAFESDFVDVADGGATGSTPPPQCTGQAQARTDGYSITSSDTDTVLWCFGTSGGARVLDLVDNRRYPLEVIHPDLSVAVGVHTDYGQLSSLSHLISGRTSVLAPGGSISYGVDTPYGTQAGVETTLDGFGQSLDALQTGVTTLVEILTKLGFAKGGEAVAATNTALGELACADALGHGPVAVLTACFSPKALLESLGSRALLVVPLMTLGPVVAFFHSEFDALADTFTGHDSYNIAISHVAPPAVAACSAALLFAAAAASEHINPADPRYAGVGGPGASAVACDEGWAYALISRPEVGDQDGGTAFHSVDGSWVELGTTGEGAECDLTAVGVPQPVAIVLSGGQANDPIADCISTPGEVPTLEAPEAGASEDAPFYEPTQLLLSGDATNGISDITWSSWTGTEAVGHGTWGYLSCIPDCADSPSVPYPATITLTDPVDGSFTMLVEQTSGPEGFSSSFSYPGGWVTYASGGISPS